MKLKRCMKVNDFWSKQKKCASDIRVIPVWRKTGKIYTSVLTQLCGGLHQAPGLTPPLADDEVQHVGLQTILQHLMQCRAQVLQDEVTHVGTHPAVPQFSLAGVVGKQRKWKENESGNWEARCKPSLLSLELCVNKTLSFHFIKQNSQGTN